MSGFIWSSDEAGSYLIAEVLLNVRTKVEVFVFWFINFPYTKVFESMKCTASRL